MKVILSVEPVRFPLTGIGRYAYELALELKASGELESLRLFSGRRLLSSLPELNSAPDNAHRLRRVLQRQELAVEVYRLLAPLLRKKALAGHSDFLYHSTNFFLPPFRGKTVATVHDLSAFKWPQCHDPAKLRYLQRGLEATFRTADALITDSVHTRDEVLAFSGLPAKRVHAVPLAAGPEFYPMSGLEVAPVMARHRLDYGGYSLFVGTIEPRKNLSALLKAYRLLPEAFRCRFPLVIIGYRGWQSDDIHQQIHRAVTEGWARYLGFLPAQDLPALYAGARLFAFPSHYEGFGLPVLEAMQSGTPVVCSNASCLPEVAGGVAKMVDPDDVDGLSLSLRSALEDDQWRHQAAREGLRRAALFSWRQCSRQTVEVYRTVLG